MYCPHCGKIIKPNQSTWSCKPCKRTYMIIEHRFGKEHILVAGEDEWNWNPKFEGEQKKEVPKQ